VQRGLSAIAEHLVCFYNGWRIRRLVTEIQKC